MSAPVRGAKPIRPLEVGSGYGADYYNGTKQQIIEAGLASDGMFPGDPGRNPTSQTFDEHGRPFGHRGGIGAILQITRMGTRFRVCRRQSTTERKQRQVAEAREKDLQKARKALEPDRFQSSEAFCAFVAGAFSLWTNHVLTVFSGPGVEGSCSDHNCGYSLGEGLKERIREIASDACHEIRGAHPGVVFDPALAEQLRMARLAPIAESAKSNSTLQRLLAGAQTAAGGAR